MTFWFITVLVWIGTVAAIALLMLPRWIPEPMWNWIEERFLEAADAKRHRAMWRDLWAAALDTHPSDRTLPRYYRHHDHGATNLYVQYN